jgi:ribosomal protein S18 acetylase RimI-like enzyme
MAEIDVVEADLARFGHARDFLALMDHFTRDPMGGGRPLPEDVRHRLVPALLERTDVTVLLGYEDDRAVALATCIEGFSTYAARPLWNLHDMVVVASHRGRGIGLRMLAEVERRARDRGYCKITLEVLGKNERAQAVYRRAGFVGYTVDGDGSGALFWEKPLGAPEAASA